MDETATSADIARRVNAEIRRGSCFDIAQSFDAVNKVAAKGGSLDVGGPVIAGGMTFVVSGYPGFGAMPGNALLAFSAN